MTIFFSKFKRIFPIFPIVTSMIKYMLIKFGFEILKNSWLGSYVLFNEKKENSEK